jgi:ribonuclease-3 family protein
MNNNETKNTFEQFAKEMQQKIGQYGDVKQSDIRMYNPLVLAYIGDAVYEMFVRTLLASSGSMQVAKLHKKAINYVKAKSQAEILVAIEEMLTPDEQDIVRRGRNTKSATVPKNADIGDYRYATGLEALVGYLYLTGSIDRLMEILDRIVEIRK